MLNSFKNLFESISKEKEKCLSYINNNQKIKNIIEKFKSFIISIKNNKYIKFLNKKVIIVPVIMMFVFFLGSIVADVTHKEDVFIKKVERALEKGSTTSMLNLIKVEKDIQLTKNDIKPLIEFYKEDTSRIKVLIESLRKGRTMNSLTLCKNNKNSNYYLNLELNDIEIISNFQGSSVYINGLNKGQTDEDGKLKVKDLVPGVYDIEVEKKSDYGSVKKNVNVVLVDNSNINILLDANFITINSNFQDGLVYINGKNSNIKVKDFINIGPFNKDETTTLMIKAQTPWGILSSSECAIGEHPTIELNIDLKDSKVLDGVNDAINRFYFSVFKALNSEDKDDIVNARDEVKNDVYAILNRRYFWLKNSYEVTDLDIKIKNSEIDYNGDDYIGNIVVTISYKIKKQIFGINIKSEEYKENFFTQIKYENDQWIVCDINNFSLEGLDNIQ